ncbi:P-loop NTPase [Aliarcobacter butzleri]|uniref:P-loop NTPase n=2 Tax=Aliarcobacter butzleri TaxID=28197 RepID=A0AAW6VI76_9BACT|nr:P-loop NTPase [Aliarcobacter butzleri]EFU70071.1 ATP-binding protein [Aliarcobacter butzleri JV22]KLD97036.1 ATP-binding protein [Aliarcobacter butzleri L349]KLE01086.1 ATP-binding protein [Aliarcobacter butzleri L348]MCG3672607.1 P-loop NTPase [Aliarcobacter butzleri]MCG3681552.1 P-loop NTPase [Aliarcobacter butzleri]
MLDAKLSQASKLIDITSNIKKNIQNSRTKLLTITSGKGGVGKSTFTANIAFLLAQKDLKIAVLDADIGLANMQVLFDIKPQYTLFEYINGQKNLSEVILQTKYKNISLIAGKSGYQYASGTNSFVFTRLVNDIISLNQFDILIVDTGAGLNDYVKEFLSISENILAITTTDPSALTDVYSLLKMLAIDKDSLMLCFNHTKSYHAGETITNSLVNLAKKNRLKEDFMIKYLGSITSSENISITGRLRKLFVSEFPMGEITIQMQRIVEKILINIR